MPDPTGTGGSGMTPAAPWWAGWLTPRAWRAALDRVPGRYLPGALSGRLGRWAPGIELASEPVHYPAPPLVVPAGPLLRLRFDPGLQQPSDAERVAAGQPVLLPASTDGHFSYVPGAALRVATVVEGPGRAYLELALEAHDECPPLAPLALQTVPGLQLIERARQAGIVGLGGAGFALFAKLRAARAAGVQHLVINAVECEPGLMGDRLTLSQHAGEVDAGARLLARAIDAPGRVLALADGESAPDRWSGALLRVPHRYPAGDERQLVWRLTGRRLPPGRRPHEEGVLVVNVATARSFLLAVRDGLAQMGRLVCVHGTGLREPRIALAFFGTPIAALLGHLGVAGTAVTRGDLVVREGGPMMGRRLDLTTASVSAATTGLLVTARVAWGKGRAPGPARKGPWPAPPPDDDVGAAACIRCGDCENVCPERLQPQRLWSLARAERLADLGALGLANCTGCRCCDVVCPSQLPLAAAFATARRALSEAEMARCAALQARTLSARRERRLEARAARDAAAREARRARLGAAPESRRAALSARLARRGAGRRQP